MTKGWGSPIFKDVMKAKAPGRSSPGDPNPSEHGLFLRVRSVGFLFALYGLPQFPGGNAEGLELRPELVCWASE